MNNGQAIINDVREMIREDATPEEYQELLDSVSQEPYITVYERRSAAIVAKWEREADRRKAAEDKLPKLSPEVRGHLAYLHYKNNVDILRAEGII